MNGRATGRWESSRKPAEFQKVRKAPWDVRISALRREVRQELNAARVGPAATEPRVAARSRLDPPQALWAHPSYEDEDEDPEGNKLPS